MSRLKHGSEEAIEPICQERGGPALRLRQLATKAEHDDQLDAMTQFLNHVGRDRTRKTRALGRM